MKNTLRLILTLAGLALLTAPALRADEPAAPPTDKPAHPGRREEMREHFKQMVKELNLTPDQQAKGEAIFKQSSEARKAIQDDTTLGEDQKRAKFKELRKSTEDQIHALLTPDQMAKLKALRESHRQHGDQPPADKPPGN